MLIAKRLISMIESIAELDYCKECISPDGRRWPFDSGDRIGTAPIAVPSTQEHRTLEHLLKALWKSHGRAGLCEDGCREPSLVVAESWPCGLPSSHLRAPLAVARMSHFRERSAVINGQS